MRAPDKHDLTQALAVAELRQAEDAALLASYLDQTIRQAALLTALLDENTALLDENTALQRENVALRALARQRLGVAS